MNKSKKLIEHLDMWEWTTLVAAWRYYEHRHTIASALFPSDILERFWRSGKYSDAVKREIANQFALVDHHNGEDDWAHDDTFGGMDAEPWCKFLAFCRAWCEGFTRLTLDDGKGWRAELGAFFCERTKRWYPCEDYIANPLVERWCADELIVAKKEAAI